MKLAWVVLTGLVAVAHTQTVATPNPESDIESINQFCSQPGQPCLKMKRAAEAVAEALAEPAPIPEAEAEARRHHHHVWCWLVGQPCNKAKRSAVAVAEAFADAHAAANPSALAGIFNFAFPFPLLAC